MKTYKLNLVQIRKVYASIVVDLNDDQSPNLLIDPAYQDSIKIALQDQDPDWMPGCEDDVTEVLAFEPSEDYGSATFIGDRLSELVELSSLRLRVEQLEKENQILKKYRNATLKGDSK